MLIRIMTLKFNPVLEQFDDAAFQECLKDKEILCVKDHFFIKNDTPYITSIIECHENPDDASAQSKLGKSDESWKDILKPHELPLFNTLRSWRADRARKEKNGVAAKSGPTPTSRQGVLTPKRGMRDPVGGVNECTVGVEAGDRGGGAGCVAGVGQEAGASMRRAFPSWSLGTRMREEVKIFHQMDHPYDLCLSFEWRLPQPSNENC